MKISYNWLKEYINTNLPAAEISELLTNTGLEVEGLEEIETVKGGLKGVVIGEVLTCGQHPNADRLKVTTVNVGGAEPLNIVCGAPNVAAGQKVVVATVGTEIFTDEGSFKIKKSKIRGEVSEGMICAEDELGLGQSHDGIMVLDAKAEVGTPAAAFFNIESDWVFEIGLTPNRTDAISHVGVARDLRAALLRFGHDGVELQQPSVASFAVNSKDLPVDIKIEDPKACYRYAGVSLKDVKVGPSPDWLQNRLRAIGLSPINNVVDITNFIMHETGHPLHAFDLAKIAGNSIHVKTLEAGTKFTTLDEKEHELHADDLMICDDHKGLVLAGVFGGLESGVSETTTNVFLEAAHFNPVSIRKAAKRHGLNTDSSFRYERGVDPEMTLYALKRAAILIRDIAGGEIAMDIRDEHPTKIEPHEVSVDLKRMTQLIGQEIETELVKNILTWLDIRIKAESGGTLHLEIPAYRHDVTREADVVEEVLRIYGFNAVAFDSKMQISVAQVDSKDAAAYREKISAHVSARGFLEMINNSLTKPAYYQGHGFDATKSVEMLNPLSQDLAVLRQDLLFGGLESIAYNIKRQRADLRLYEFGRHYQKGENRFKEEERLALWITGAEAKESWRESTRATDFFTLKNELVHILAALGLEKFQENPLENELFDEALQIEVFKNEVAVFGRVKTTLARQMDIKQPVYYANLNWAKLAELAAKQRIVMKDLPRFPEVRRDLALLLDESIRYSDLKQAAEKAERKILRDVNLFDVYQGKNLPAGKKSYALSFILQDQDKTLNDKQVDKAMEKILASFKKQFEAELR